MAANYILLTSRNPYRRWCNSWWLHWLKIPRRLCIDIRDAFERASNGYAKSDIFDLCSYHAGLTRGIMQHYLDKHVGHPQGIEAEEYGDKLRIIVDGWTAMELLLSGGGLQDDATPAQEKAWRAALEKRWKAGMKEFVKWYPSFWQ